MVIERKAKYKVVSDFYNEFKAKVKINIENGQYDKACDNYAALVQKYSLTTPPKPQQTVDTATTSDQNSQDTTPSKSTLDTPTGTADNTANEYSFNDYDAVALKKVNYLTEVINKFSPKAYSSFKTYAKTAGTDKNKRQKEQFTDLGGMKVKIPNQYRVHAYFGGSYKTNAIHALKEALSINRLSSSDKTIKSYLDSIENFTQLFTEASEYYEMKDYTDDNFKKADKIHTPLITAFEEFVKYDDEIRAIVEKVSDEQAKKRIVAYKSSKQLMFYYVENAQYLAKKYYRYASHKYFLKLDAKKVRALYDKLRDHYQAFKTYKQENETVFKDNNAYTSYLRDFRDYVSNSKEFYIRVKSKKAYPNGEGEMLKHVPPQARAAIEANIKGSIQSLLKDYNALVDEYNGLNM